MKHMHGFYIGNEAGRKPAMNLQVRAHMSWIIPMNFLFGKCFCRYQFLGKRFMFGVLFGIWLARAKVVETTNNRTTKHQNI
jgi:hypothetical protein